MISQGSGNKTDQPIFSRLWGSGFLPDRAPGRALPLRRRPGALPLEPAGHRRRSPPAHARRRRRAEPAWPRKSFGDPEINTRIAQYEMAFRMQTSVPELTDLSERAEARSSTCTASTTTASTAASPATACWPGGWSSAACASSSSCTAAGTSTATCPKQIRGQCQDVDQPAAALVKDLKQRGLLDDTLVIWGGEFGRTVYSQGALTRTTTAATTTAAASRMWMAGGGIKPGITYGETDDYCYNIVDDPVHIHDLNATILHCLGIDHTRLTFRFQGRDFRLTDVHGNVVKGLLPNGSVSSSPVSDASKMRVATRILRSVANQHRRKTAVATSTSFCYRPASRDGIGGGEPMFSAARGSRQP